MLEKLAIFDQLAINVGCFSDDGKKLYGFSEYYNELFEIDMENNTTVSLGQLGSEDDNMHMFFEMIYCCGKLLCIPRNANNFYIYDTLNGNQTAFPKNELSDRVSIGPISFASIKAGKYVYTVYRKYMLIYRIDMENCTLKKINNSLEGELVNVSQFTSHENTLILYSAEKGRLFSFCTETEKMKEIHIDTKITASGGVYFNGREVWFYCIEEGILYHCDITSGQIRCIDLKMKGRYAVAFLYSKNLNYLLLEGESYFIFDDENAQLMNYPSNDLDGHKYFRLPIGSIYFRCYDPQVYGKFPSKVHYLKLDVNEMRFCKFTIPMPLNQNSHFISQRIWQVFQKKILVESESVSLQVFLELIVEWNKEPKCMETESFGRSIYKQITLLK